ncbi:uncharacterized protein BP01DRAFT_411171 [Aspergillus saccharolyticus JOP 1030-1]|uniref:Cytochrome b2 n=1 Tax=Aspergillus saccharolyticus JOP 1030-1 TaxID=1450539 RepID=A0A318ZHS9_9EURO|nr:hypothetical protein BP01DRAFT_411171 [Aspergillus saccharolyticus JOP 1030-1]PYH47116.1 hypothetical protein BP01DRAFT_411171 [Aspergillus saccharolyticus JOP 1030-1]
MTNREISAAEVEAHNREDDVWIVVNGKVYEVTEFAPRHPGGAEVIYRFAGRDASNAYNTIHSPALIATDLSHSCQGELNTSTVPENWRKTETEKGSRQTDSDSWRSSVETYRKPSLQELLSLHDFETIAQRLLSPKAWAYNSGAANDNLTRDANQTMLRRILLRPAVMRDVSTVTMRRTLLGCSFELPVYIAPVGAAKTVCPEGELPLAHAANPAGIVQCIATTASFTLPEILDATPAHAFLQLYINRDRAKTETQVRQATASGKVKAFLITADLPVMSKREADERLPSEGDQGTIVNVSREQAAPETSNQQSSNAPGKQNAGLAKSTSSFIDPTLNWQDIAWLRAITHLPLLIKGIQRAEDARLAMQFGLDGIVVSNHGGRAADTAPPSILTLLELRRDCPEVFEQMTVLVDGGFRRGSDVLKAICLGASAVGLGRPFAYALTYGEEGVMHAIAVMKQELATAMQLVGLTDLRDANPGYINTADLQRLLPVDDLPPLIGKKRLMGKL